MSRIVLVLLALATIAPSVSRADREIYKAAFGDSIGASVQYSRNRNLWLVEADSRRRFGIGYGKTFKLSPLKNFGETSLTPMVAIYGQPSRGSRLDLLVISEWSLPSKNPTRTRHITSFQMTSALIAQLREPTIVRVTQSFNTFDNFAKRGPLNQGMEMITEFRPDGVQGKQQNSDRGAATEVSRQRFNFEQWVFANWRVGPGLLQMNIGATYRKRNQAPADSSDQGQSLNERTIRSVGKQSTISPVLLWRIGFTVNR